jgi:transposase
VFRRALIKDRTAARTRLKTVRQPLLRRLLVQRLAQIDRQMTGLDSAMQDIIAADPGLRDRLEMNRAGFAGG